MDNKNSFEEAFAKLQEISDKIEKESLTLNESIALFEEGVKLSAYCSKILDECVMESFLENGDLWSSKREYYKEHSDG